MPGVSGKSKGWSDKRDRQYEHIKEGVRDSGRPEATAERIAAATVNKARAEKGETKGARARSTRRTAGTPGKSGTTAKSASTRKSKG